jgi:hypothetical protein
MVKTKMPKETEVAKKRGRPAGSLNHKTCAILAQARKDGVTPPQAMLKLMRRWNKLALRSEANAQMQRAEDFRERALQYAVAALPHFHRRLGSVKCTAEAKPAAVVLRYRER